MKDAPANAPLPATIDRTAADRVLARALELQAASGNDPEGRLTQAQLESLAKEVGLDPIHVRQALAEEKTRSAVPDTDRGVLASMYGASIATAERVVRGTATQVLKALDDWMQREESLVVQRYHQERIVWEARRDFVGTMKRGFSGRAHALVRATSVGATVIAVDESRVVVRLDAHLAGYRSLMAQQNVGFTATAVVAGAVLATLSFPILAAAAPALLVVPISYGAARSSHGKSVLRAQLALEQVLDRLERGEAGRPPSIMSMLAAAVGARL